MHCRKVRRNLSAFLDSVLPAVIREQITEHVKDCPKCRKALNQLQELKPILISLSVPPVPEDMTGQVLAGAKERLAQRQPDRKPVWPLFRWWTMETWATRLASVAVLVIGLVAGSFLGRRTSRDFIGSFFPASINRLVDHPMVRYELDFLSGDTGGSIEQIYLAMVLRSEKKEE
jgi:anti-sigma factor RsiW